MVLRVRLALGSQLGLYGNEQVATGGAPGSIDFGFSAGFGKYWFEIGLGLPDIGFAPVQIGLKLGG